MRRSDFLHSDEALSSMAAVIIAELEQLELAWSEEQLPDALSAPRVDQILGPDIRAFYEDVLQHKLPKPNSVRKAALPAALLRLQRALRSPSRWSAASLAPHTSSNEDDTALSSPRAVNEPDEDQRASENRALLATIRRGSPAIGDNRREIRWDQAIDARFWGIGLNWEADDAGELARALRALLCQRTLQELADALRSIVAVQQRVHERTAALFAHFRFAETGHDFEQLVLDILNEEERIARHASLREDWLEQTDIRLRYPELQRNRGARAQVCLSPDEKHTEKKLERLIFPKEFTVISPRTLAEHTSRGALHEFLTEDEIDEFWASFHHLPADVDELSCELRALFGDALTAKREKQTGLGPIDAIPPAIRRYVRGFARREAIRSTAALRERESTEGQLTFRERRRRALRPTT